MLDIIEHQGIREIRLARPPVNALDGDMLQGFITAMESARSADAIVVTGQPGVFSAGLDVPRILALDRAGMAQVFAAVWRAQQVIALSPVPVVFGITGHCPAGGTVLAIHADYRVMAAGEFRLGLNEVQVGLFPGPVIAGAFHRLVGGHAAQLLTRGALIDPETALRVGLIDEITEPARCVARALEVAREFCSLPREPMTRTRELARRDLVEIFGDTGRAVEYAREFGETGAAMFSVPATQERLRVLFARKK